MKRNLKKFLEFKGKNIYFVDIDGTYWVAVKPICEVLEVDYIRQFKNLKSDKILSLLLSNQTMVDAGNKLRNMVCLPEKYVYGWLFSIQSSSEKLLDYKRECYEILFDYFRGTIIKKQEVLQEKAEKLFEKKEAFEKLRETEAYQNYIKVNGEIKTLDKISKSIDDEFVNEKIKTLFDQDFVPN